MKQVGGTYITSFIVTQSGIYSTNSSYWNEHGERIEMSSYWGLMQIPAEIKVILKVQFYYLNVIIVDQDNLFYANGFNGQYNFMLCYDGFNTYTFKPLGQLKHVSMFYYFSFLINQTNHIEVCG